jgi:hypothetical protein
MPERLVKNINRGHQGGPFSPHRFPQRRVDSPDLPGNGRTRQGVKELFPRIQNGKSPVQAAKFQITGPQIRPGYPEGQGQCQGAGTKVGNGVSIGQGEGQGREKPGKAVHIPGKKIPEVRRKRGGPAQVPAVPFRSVTGEEPGKLRHIPGKGRHKTSGQGECPVDKAGQGVKGLADSKVQGREEGLCR